jgi:hypothetical protein
VSADAFGGLERQADGRNGSRLSGFARLLNAARRARHSDSFSEFSNP